MTIVANKRRYSRSDCFVPVIGKPGEYFANTKTVDISRRGLGFLSKESIPIGKRVTIELDFSEFDDSVLVIGEVMWSRFEQSTQHYRIGLNFVDILWGSRLKLDRHFRRDSVRRWI